MLDRYAVSREDLCYPPFMASFPARYATVIVLTLLYDNFKSSFGGGLHYFSLVFRFVRNKMLEYVRKLELSQSAEFLACIHSLNISITNEY